MTLIEKHRYIKVMWCVCAVALYMSVSQAGAETHKNAAASVDPMFYEEAGEPKDATKDPEKGAVTPPVPNITATTPLATMPMITGTPQQAMQQLMPQILTFPENGTDIPAVLLMPNPLMSPKMSKPETLLMPAVTLPKTPAAFSPKDPLATKTTDVLQAAPLQSIPTLPQSQSPAVMGKGVAIEEDANVSWHGSLMFNANTIRLLNEAIQASISGKPLDAPVINAPAQKRIALDHPVISPTFYLNSILYFSPQSWAVWLNNSKISSSHETPRTGVKIVKVTPYAVTFSLAVKYLNHLSPQWSKKLLEDDEEGAFANSNLSIILNAEKNTLSFTLHANQVFSMYDMEIFEGKASPSALQEFTTENKDSDNTTR
jgi:hypothetical protein